ncbi:exportin-2-like [Pithys albifrons albifrons]|uniref:exportin-2-like n=1 Tax=Pithys albifrons albifrons TaxID=3385563 RepID=UPI003A5CCC46
MAGPAEPSRAAAPSAATRGAPRRVLECAAVPGQAASCAGAEYEALSPVLPLLLDATSRVRSWRCFPAPAAAGAAGARGEHPAAGAAAPEAFLERGAGTIARSAAAKIPGVLGGFLKLIALKASDPQGFDLLNSIMEHMPPESVDWYRKQVFILLFQRLPSSKPTKLIKRFLCCRPSLLGLFELLEDDTTPDKEHFIDTEDTPGYQTAFSQLAFAGKEEHDPVGQMVNNPRIQLVHSVPRQGRWLGLCIPGLHSAEKKCLCENGLLLRFVNQQNEVCCRQKARSCCVFLFIGTWLL